MTSRRSILLSLVLGAVLSFMSLNEANAQVPRSISYQGLLLQSGQPVNAQVNLHIKIYNAAGTVLYEESFNQLQVNNGLYNVLLGGNSGTLPASLKFDEQYYLGVEINNTGEVTPRTPFVAAPYALNSQTVGGFAVSATPQPGTLLPLDANGKIPKAVLPQANASVSTIDGVIPDANGNIQLVGVNGITVTDNSPATGQITIGFSGAGNGGGIQHIQAGAGLTGGGSDSSVTIKVADNGITNGMLGTGVVTGRNLDQFIAGPGLSQDILGNLGVNVDATLHIVNDQVGIDLSHGNTWTGVQNFAGGVVFGGPVTIGILTVTGLSTFNGIVNTGTLDQQGNIFNSSSNNGGAVTVNDPQGFMNNAGNIVNTSGNINNLNGNINNTGRILENGSPNMNLPVGPSGIPTGFNTPGDFDVIDNGDLQVTGWSSLNNATVQNLWINGALNLGSSASFCASNIQVQSLNPWCGGPTLAIGLTDAFTQTSLNSLPANTFLTSNFVGNVGVTNVLTIGVLGTNASSITTSNPGTATINLQTPSVSGRMPTFQTYVGTLSPGTGTNGGAAVVFNLGSNVGTANVDGMMATYRTSAVAGTAQGVLTITQTASGDVMIESTSANDMNSVQLTILRP